MIVKIIDGDEIISGDTTKEKDVKTLETSFLKFKKDGRFVTKVVLKFEDNITIPDVNDIFRDGDEDNLVTEQIVYLKTK